jgi:hypothetical protein
MSLQFIHYPTYFNYAISKLKLTFFSKINYSKYKRRQVIQKQFVGFTLGIFKKIAILINSIVFVSNFAFADDSITENPDKKPVEIEKPAEAKADKALFFNPLLNGMPKPKILFDYEIKDEEIRLGQAVLSEETFKVFVGETNLIDPALNTIAELKDSQILVVSIPDLIQETQAVEILTENGDVVWHSNYETSDRELGIKTKEAMDSALFKSKENLTVLVKKINLNNVPVLAGETKERFKICLTQHDDQNFSTICSPIFKISTKTKRLSFSGESGPIKSYVDGKEVAPKNILTVETESGLHFFAASRNQYSIELKVKPREIYLVDFYKDANTNSVILTGHTTFPVGQEVTFLNPEDKTAWLYKLGWLPTIGDLTKYWKASVKTEASAIYLYGIGGGLFKYSLDLTKVPLDKNRIFIDNNNLKSTYAEEVPVYGVAPIGTKVSSEQKNATIIDEATGKFVWNFEAENKGEYLTKNLMLSEAENKWITSYSLYRGFSSEFSLRTAGTLAQDKKITFFGELAFSHWFESILDSQNYLFSRQRWGFSFRSFQPFSKLKSNTRDNSGLSEIMVDLKYRLTPGLWEYDETWGLIMSNEDVSINGKSVSVLGAGFFWVRSMPKVFDDIFNLFPFMNYAKSVDMDFVYYSNSLKPNIDSKGTYALNFHGKVLWSKTIFGEAGFGIKSYSFKDFKSQDITILRSFYGTVGLGINF